MSIAASAISELSIAAQSRAKAPTKPPRTRQTIARADAAQVPEAR